MAKNKKAFAGGLLSLVGFVIVGLALFLFLLTENAQVFIDLGIFSFTAFTISFYIFKSENPFLLSEKLSGTPLAPIATDQTVQQ